tara:strand:+ start:37 stop:528 length:492 start_codon:yes stop_codon:yes gene_type:complete
MRRSASEIIRNLEIRIAKLEKSASLLRNKKVMAEIDDLVGEDNIFYDDDSWCTIVTNSERELESVYEEEGLDRWNMSRVEYEITIHINDLVHDDAQILNTRTKPYHLVDYWLRDKIHTIGSKYILSSNSQAEVKRIGQPTIEEKRGESVLCIPVKIEVVASRR